MNLKKLTSSRDLYLIDNPIFHDERGYFFENFASNIFSEIGIEFNVLQQNISFSKKNCLRGLHYQTKNTQAKYVSVLSGSVLDVVVDVRINSPTFGNYYSVILNSVDKASLFIPRGYAHGFLVLSDDALFSYFVDNKYNPEFEKTIIWNDPSLNISWGINSPTVSSKDNKGLFFKDAEYLN